MNKKIKAIAFLLICFLLSTFLVSTSAEEPKFFKDVNPEDCFYEDVMTLYQRGIVENVGSEYFCPGSYITEQDFLVLLYRMNGINDIVKFSKYENDKSAAEQVIKKSAPNKNNFLTDLGIIGALNSPLPIARDKAITFAAEFFGIVEPISQDFLNNPFSDIKEYEYSNVKNLYSDYLITAYHSGLISSFENHTIKPDENLTRAEACKILLTFEKVYLSGDIERPMPKNFENVNIEFDCLQFKEYSQLSKSITAIPEEYLKVFKNDGGTLVLTDKHQSEYGFPDNTGGLYTRSKKTITIFNNAFRIGTMHHEFAHYLWYEVLTSKEKAVILKSYNSEELENFTRVTREYSKTNVAEYWAELIMYKLDPNYKNAVENCGCEAALNIANKYFS